MTLGAGAINVLQSVHEADPVEANTSNVIPAAQQLLQYGLFVCTVLRAYDPVNRKPVRRPS